MPTFKRLLLEMSRRLKLTAPPFHMRHWRWIRLFVLVSVDVVLVGFAYYAAFVLRLDDFRLGFYWSVFVNTLPVAVACHAVAFFVGGMYRQVWRYANMDSAILITKCVVFGTIITVTANFLFERGSMPPRSVPIIFGLIATLLVALSKFSWRAWATIQITTRTEKERCFIYGAGAAGDLLARHIAANPRFPYIAVGYLDDDRNKRGRVIHGLRIVGSGADLAQLCHRDNVQTVILAMHAPSGKVIRTLVERCHEAGVKPLIMPDIANSLNGEALKPRAVDVKDLLRRSPKSIDRERVRLFFNDRSVLVTGAGGSIGSEICRQIFECKPSRIILFDSSEYNLYKIEQELRGNAAAVDIIPVLGSVRCERTVERVFALYKPTYVLHAAAYKHVPMVEGNAREGILNNIEGTNVVAEAAIRHGVARFLLVSTDKAVRPTNVMGATKRCCEILIQSLHQRGAGRTSFCAVRFGNVLGSSGSVVPRFLEQIQSGGPVTVTHPEVTRYFMLISEAVGLVLQSITMATGGEIFVLDMGEPVKIADMARQLIVLAGKEPGRDIEIVYSGLRPGEKLYEELIIESAERHTLHDDVYVATPHPTDPRENLKIIERILTLAGGDSTDEATGLLMAFTGAEKQPQSSLEDQPRAIPLH